jgi:hypothetical protein
MNATPYVAEQAFTNPALYRLSYGGASGCDAQSRSVLTQVLTASSRRREG